MNNRSDFQNRCDAIINRAGGRVQNFAHADKTFAQRNDAQGLKVRPVVPLAQDPIYIDYYNLCKIDDPRTVFAGVKGPLSGRTVYDTGNNNGDMLFLKFRKHVIANVWQQSFVLHFPSVQYSVTAPDPGGELILSAFLVTTDWDPNALTYANNPLFPNGASIGDFSNMATAKLDDGTFANSVPQFQEFWTTFVPSLSIKSAVIADTQGGLTVADTQANAQYYDTVQTAVFNAGGLQTPMTIFNPQVKDATHLTLQSDIAFTADKVGTNVFFYVGTQTVYGIAVVVASASFADNPVPYPVVEVQPIDGVEGFFVGTEF